VRKAFTAAVPALLALALAPLAQATHVPTLPSISGAVFTTVNLNDPNYPNECHNGNPMVNCNQYTAKQFVYLNGGPSHNQLSPDGVYFYAVLDPSGQSNPNDGSPENLSDNFDCYQNREVQITNGEVSAIYSSSAPGPGCPGGAAPHQLAGPLGPFVQLFPYADTTNPGGVYIMAVCYVGPTGTRNLPAPVTPSLCKYDAFKVQVDNTPPTCKLISTTKGPPKSITVAVQDPGAGLESVDYTTTNASVTFPTPLSVGSTVPFYLTATKTDQTQASTLSVVVTDVAGNQTKCDPVLPARRVVHLAGSARKVVSHIAATQTWLQVRNGARPTAEIVVKVNGHFIRLRHLKPHAVRNMPIPASWLNAGTANRIVIRRTKGYGHAVVTIG